MDGERTGRRRRKNGRQPKKRSVYRWRGWLERRHEARKERGTGTQR